MVEDAGHIEMTTDLVNKSARPRRTTATRSRMSMLAAAAALMAEMKVAKFTAMLMGHTLLATLSLYPAGRPGLHAAAAGRQDVDLESVWARR
jgi:hypothetical protein